MRRIWKADGKQKPENAKQVCLLSGEEMPNVRVDMLGTSIESRKKEPGGGAVKNDRFGGSAA